MEDKHCAMRGFVFGALVAAPMWLVVIMIGEVVTKWR